ncbi:MAG: hypothetical protein ACKVIH_04095 [Burkholderiales bacterium]
MMPTEASSITALVRSSTPIVVVPVSKGLAGPPGPPGVSPEPPPIPPNPGDELMDMTLFFNNALI